jgi:hypothetical protein
MSNDNQEFDDLLRQRFDDYHPDPSDDTWGKIAGKLTPASNTRPEWPKWAALLLLLGGVLTWVYQGVSSLTPVNAAKTASVPKKELTIGPAVLDEVLSKPKTKNTLSQSLELREQPVLESFSAFNSRPKKAVKAFKTNKKEQYFEVQKQSKSASKNKNRQPQFNRRFDLTQQPKAEITSAAVSSLSVPTLEQQNNLRLNLAVLPIIPLKTRAAFLTIPTIQHQPPATKAAKQNNPLEWRLTATPFLVFQQVAATPQPEVGYLINMTNYAPLSVQRTGIQLQLNAGKKWKNSLAWQLGAGYTYLPQWIDYEWFTGDFKVEEVPSGGLLIERNAKVYVEKSARHLGQLSGALRYELGTKSWLPKLEANANWHYDFSRSEQLLSAGVGAEWQYKRLSFGARFNYFLTPFEDQQQFVKINPHTLGALVGWQLK